MATRTKRILVNFYQIKPNPATELSFDRLQNAFAALDVTTLNDRPHRLDYVLDGEGVKRDKGLLFGAINNGQTGGVMPLRRGGKGVYKAPIDPGERLGHLSCFVYDIEQSILLLESLPNGTSPSDWCFYFKSHLQDSPVMEWAVIEKQTSENLLNDFKYVTRFEIAVAGYRRNDLFSEQAPSRSIGEVSDLARAGQANTVNCILSTDVRRYSKKKKQRIDQESLDKNYLGKLLDKIRGEPEVETLSISGLYEEEDPAVDVINLLEFRLKDKIEVPITELGADGLNIAKRVIRLKELLTKHKDILSRYERPHES